MNVIPVSDGVTVQVRDASIGAGGTADLGNAASGAGVTVESLGFEMRFDSSRFRVEVSTPTAAGTSPPDGTTIASFSADIIGARSAVIDGRTITFSVAESALPDGASMDDVMLFVRTADGWERVSLSRTGGTFSAETDTFGKFAVSVATQSSTGTTETPEVTETTTTDSQTQTERTTSGSPTETQQSTETEFPGLGVTHALIALAAALLMIRRRNR